MARVVLALVLLAGCARMQRPTIPEPRLVGADGAPVSDDAFVAQARDAAFVLIGEAHDDACHHALQARLVRALGAARVPFALALEMATVDRYEPLDRFNAGTLPLGELDAALDWPKTWGFPFALYAPVFDAAHAAGAPVVPANAPKALLARIGSPVDDLPERVRARLAPSVVEPLPAQEESLRAVFDAHVTHLPPGTDAEAAWTRFRRTQAAWDSQMAFVAAAERRETGRLVVVLAGAGHVANGWGIAHRLATFAPGERVVSVVPAGAGAGDVVVLCDEPMTR